jgi:hypothetical protein
MRSRIVAVLCGCAIVAIIIFVVAADNLNRGAVFELSWIAFGLCLGLAQWHNARVKTGISFSIGRKKILKPD